MSAKIVTERRLDFRWGEEGIQPIRQLHHSNPSLLIPCAQGLRRVMPQPVRLSRWLRRVGLVYDALGNPPDVPMPIFHTTLPVAVGHITDLHLKNRSLREGSLYAPSASSTYK